MQKSFNPPIYAEIKARAAEMKLSLIKHRGNSFDEATVDVNKKLWAASVNRVDSPRSRDEVFLRLKAPETAAGESLKVMSERTTKDFSMMSKQHKTILPLLLRRVFTEFRYETVKSFGNLKAFLSEFTMGARRKIANFVAVLSSWWANVCEASSVKSSASASGSCSAAAITTPLASAGQSFMGIPQHLDTLQIIFPYSFSIYYNCIYCRFLH